MPTFHLDALIAIPGQNAKGQKVVKCYTARLPYTTRKAPNIAFVQALREELNASFLPKGMNADLIDKVGGVVPQASQLRLTGTRIYPITATMPQFEAMPTKPNFAARLKVRELILSREFVV